MVEKNQRHFKCHLCVIQVSLCVIPGLHHIGRLRIIVEVGAVLMALTDNYALPVHPITYRHVILLSVVALPMPRIYPGLQGSGSLSGDPLPILRQLFPADIRA